MNQATRPIPPCPRQEDPEHDHAFRGDFDQAGEKAAKFVAEALALLSFDCRLS